MSASTMGGDGFITERETILFMTQTVPIKTLHKKIILLAIEVVNVFYLLLGRLNCRNNISA